MLATSLRLSAAIHSNLQLRAPSNLLIAEIRTQRRRRAIVVAGAAATTYVALAALCAVQDGGPAWLDAVVGLLMWNGFKLAWVALLPAVGLAGTGTDEGLRARGQRNR